MDKKEPIHISSLSEFIEWVKQLGKKNHLFRGVPNAKYKIQASAYRRLKVEDRNPEKFLQINKELITEARLRGHGERNGRELGDLEILAELQHFGAATGLIDFTYNAQVALYFACQKDLKWEKNLQHSENPPYGKVYAVHNDPQSFKKVTPDLIKEKIDNFISHFQTFGRDRQLYRWKPGYQNNRIIAQQSIFVFGTHELDEDEACIIKESCKQEILIELEQVSGINEAMLFPDFDGFARLHRENVPYTEPTATDYFNRGKKAFESPEEAIANYDMAIELNPNESDYYEWRGYANRDLKRVDEAIADFDRMVEIDGSFVAYEVRGLEHFKLKRYQQAIADFRKVIELAPDSAYGYGMLGEVMCELEQYQEAIPYLDKYLQIASKVAIYLLRGNAKEQIGDLEGARADLESALTLENEHPNTSRVDEIKLELQRIEKRIAERK